MIKKITMVLSLVAVALLIMPKEVLAAGFTDDDPHLSTEDISFGEFGTIKAGDYSWTYTDEEAGEKTWTISVDTNSKYIYFQLVPKSVEIRNDNDVKVNSGFVIVSQKENSNGTRDIFIESSGSSSRLTITVKTYDTADTGCLLNVSPYRLNCSVKIDGYYFDDNGQPISEEEYNQVCGNTTTPDDPNDIPNSDTGSVVPYIAIGGGLLAIALVYLFSKKSNKVYKI